MNCEKRISDVSRRLSKFWSATYVVHIFSFPFFFTTVISLSLSFVQLHDIGKEDSLRHADDVGCCKGGPAGPRGLLARRRRICSFGIRALSVLRLSIRRSTALFNVALLYFLLQSLFFLSATAFQPPFSPSLHAFFLSPFRYVSLSLSLPSSLCLLSLFLYY